ncbi:MAG TPA: hypothetical protein VIL71_17705 [Spirillospora sp.]
MWRARTGGREATESYRRVLESEVLGGLNDVAGFRGAYLLARRDGDAMEISTLTFFDSFEAVRRFAGQECEREQVTPAARATLLESDPAVRHFDVLTAHRL